jgi:alkylhydroperoxidase family enzyme
VKIEAGGYRAMPPRIDPVAPPYTPEAAAMLARWMPRDAGAIEPLTLFRTLARHLDLASRMLPLGAGILAHGRVRPRDREIVIQRTCARTGADYEWGVHAAVYGERVGLTPEQVRATATSDAHDPAWDPAGGRLVELADELHETATISDALWVALEREYDPDQLLELVITAGWYRLIAYVIHAARVTPEPWATPMPQSNMPGS